MTIPEAAQPFDKMAAEYDAWFEDSLLFELELAALRSGATPCPRPRLEIGTGPGRFAAALNVDFGLDPASSPLHLARRRGIIPVRATGEELPVRDRSMGTVYLLFTLCFLADATAVFEECARVLHRGGTMVTGFIPAGSPWGRHLAEKGERGHPMYRHARFRSVSETRELLGGTGLEPVEAWSTLYQAPSVNPVPEAPRPGASEDAGFCVIFARKNGGP
ncbi:MAG: hypothetical protein Kow0089_20940 [Desulfobulbaceae bacterium]